MKVKSLVAFFILSLPLTCFCQQTSNEPSDNFTFGKEVVSLKKKSKLSTGFLVGSSDHKYASAGRLGAEFTYKFSEKFALVGNYLRGEQKIDGNTYTDNDYAGGLRYYGNKGNIKFFLEGLMNLNMQKQKESFTSHSIFVANSIGVTIGAGAEFKLPGGFSGMLKYNVTKLSRSDTFKGLFGGLKYNF